uniref:Phospholipid/glycerol acyltransferase domain-containing protein n=1 Tax=Chenopodium quinoa TaxID=63459 RepID=A0A803MCE7_CHEQI
MSERKSEDGKLHPSVSTELDLDRPNIEDYLSESLPEPHGKLRLRDLIDLSPALTEAAGAIVDRSLVELICSFFVASWTGVIKYHGPRPSVRSKQIFVANHTSMIDFIVLEQMTAFAVIMQKHPGWVGLLQSTILESLGCIWFNRAEVNDRAVVQRKLRDHVHGADNNPLLIFPEGTCVNNEYTVMFKKGAFELDCPVCPVAIKYNKIFVDAFWNSKKVRDMISHRAGLKKVPWDGYLKYLRPSPRFTESK